MQKKIFFGGKFYFFKKKRWFFGRFSAFYGQRLVTAAWATRSPWSILKIFNPFFQLARPGSQHHLGAPGTSPAPASSISCSCTMHNACCCTEVRRCEWVCRCYRYKWRSRCRCYCIRCRCCSMCWNKCGCWSNINITVDTAASELVDVEVNDQEVQRRRVRGLLPPWSSDGWKNVELMLL